MNTANLQMEGLLIAVAALVRKLRDKQLLSGSEIEAALAEAEHAALGWEDRASLPQANREAILFPLRFLRAAAADSGGVRGFAETAREVGLNKPRTPET